MDFNITVGDTKTKDADKSAMEIELDDLVGHLQDSCKPPAAVVFQNDTVMQKVIEDKAEHAATKDKSKLDTNKEEMSMTGAEQQINRVIDTAITKSEQKEFKQIMSMEAADNILKETVEDNSKDDYNNLTNLNTEARQRDAPRKGKPEMVEKSSSLKGPLDETVIDITTFETTKLVETTKKNTIAKTVKGKMPSGIVTFKRDNFTVISIILSDLWLAIEKETSGDTSSAGTQSCEVVEPDMMIYCKDGSSPVHSLILAAASTFLREMLSGQCPCQREAQKMKLQDLTKSDVLQMIKLMYTGSCVVNESCLLDVSAILNQFNFNNIQIQPITTGIKSLPIITSIKSLVHHVTNVEDVTNAQGVTDTHDVTEDDLNTPSEIDVRQTVVNLKNEIIGEDFAIKQSKGDKNMIELFVDDNAESTIVEENTKQQEGACTKAVDGLDIKDNIETNAVILKNNNEAQTVQQLTPQPTGVSDYLNPQQTSFKPVSDYLNPQQTSFRSVSDLVARPESAFKPISEHLSRPTSSAFRPVSDHIPRSESAFNQVSEPMTNPEQPFKPVSNEAVQAGHPSNSAEPNHFHMSSTGGGLGAPLANSGLYPAAAAAMEHQQQYYPPYFPAGGYLQPQAPPHFGQFAAAMNMHAHYHHNPHLMAYFNPYQMMPHLSRSQTFQPPVLYNQDDTSNTGTDGLGNTAAFDLSVQSVHQEANNINQTGDPDTQDDDSNRNLDVTGDFNSNMSKSVDTVNDLLDSQDEGEGEVIEKDNSVDHDQDKVEYVTKIKEVDVKIPRNRKQEKTTIKRIIDDSKIVQSKKTKLAANTPFNSDTMKLECCKRQLDVKSFMLHCVRIHVKLEMEQAVKKEFRENRGVCPKCEKKLHDVQSYADHQGVQHRVVIDHIINTPRFEHCKDILHKLKEEFEEKNNATSSDEKSDVECIGAFVPQQRHNKCPLCNRKEPSNSLMLRHIVDAHYYFQLRKKMESDYIKKEYCRCDLEMPTLRFFIRHQAIRHQVLLEVCTPQVAKLLKNAKFKTKQVTKQVTKPKQAVVKVKNHTNEVWISSTGTTVKATTLRQTLKESLNTIYAGVGQVRSKHNNPQDGQTPQLYNSTDKTLQLVGSTDKTLQLAGSTDKTLQLASFTDKTLQLAGSTDKYQQLAGSTDKTLQLASSTDKYQQLAGSTDKTRQLASSTDNTLTLASSTDKTRQLASFTDKTLTLASSTDKTQQLAGSTGKTLQLASSTEPPQPLKSHGKLRITRMRDQNARPSRSQEVAKEMSKARKAPGQLAGLCRAPLTRIQSATEAPKLRHTRLANISKKVKQKVLPSNHFYCQMCSSVKIGYKVFLSHLSAAHYRKEISEEFGESPNTLMSKPCPICGIEIFGRNFFFHLGSKHLAVLKYATWFKPKETDESSEDTKAVTNDVAAEKEDTNDKVDAATNHNDHETTEAETTQVDEYDLKAADAYAAAAAGTEDEEDVDDPAPATGEAAEMTAVGIEDPDLVDDVVDSGGIEDKDVDPDYKIGD